MTCNTPVLLIAWRRPHTTQQVIDAIRIAAPTKLFVACDGPNPERPDEAEKVAATRAVIEKSIDWPCQVERLYSDVNQGCRLGVSRAITWFFEHVEEGIILEDDCLPNPSFFQYCQELLEKYRFDTRIMQIGGNNSLCAPDNLLFSYYFSGLVHIWGWATWKRAWSLFDIKISSWPIVKSYSAEFLDIFGDLEAKNNRIKLFDRVFDEEIDTWDYSWLYTVLSQSGLTILPAVNLVSNIGFGSDAVRTTLPDPLKSNLPTNKIFFPLIHPSFIIRSKIADQKYLNLSQDNRKRGYLSVFSRLIKYQKLRLKQWIER